MQTCANCCCPGVGAEFFILLFSLYCVAPSSTSDNANLQLRQLSMQLQQHQQQQQPTEQLPFERQQQLLLADANRRRPILTAGHLVALPQLRSPCTCAAYTCTCCLALRSGGSSRNQVCAELQFNAEQLALRLRIAYNQNTIGNFGVAPLRQPDYCLPVLLPLPLYSCLRLYDIRTFGGGNVQLCITFVLKLFTNQIFEYHFDCVQFGVNGVFALARGQQPHDAEDSPLQSEQIVKSTVTVAGSGAATPAAASAAPSVAPAANDELHNAAFQRLPAALS